MNYTEYWVNSMLWNFNNVHTWNLVCPAMKTKLNTQCIAGEQVNWKHFLWLNMFSANSFALVLIVHGMKSPCQTNSRSTSSPTAEGQQSTTSDELPEHLPDFDPSWTCVTAQTGKVLYIEGEGWGPHKLEEFPPFWEKFCRLCSHSQLSKSAHTSDLVRAYFL